MNIQTIIKDVETEAGKELSTLRAWAIEQDNRHTKTFHLAVGILIGAFLTVAVYTFLF